ncbi:MAG: hypothetical protein NC293_10855 [Roseburia sp.]|nr:hypothetical protein [Roseburia sp.]
MNDHTNSTKNRLSYIISHLSVKEKIIWVLQVLFAAAILITAILGLRNIVPIDLTNTIDLVLLLLLFIICGIKFVPERIVYAVIYFVFAALMGAILIAGSFI